MAINLDAYAEALEPPAFTVGGETYVGCLLSADQWLAFLPRLAQADAGELDEAASEALMRDIVTAFFPEPPPAPRRRWWALWRRRAAPPVVSAAEVFLALSYEQQSRGLEDFFVRQVSALPRMGRTPRTSPPSARATRTVPHTSAA